MIYMVGSYEQLPESSFHKIMQLVFQSRRASRSRGCPWHFLEEMPTPKMSLRIGTLTASKEVTQRIGMPILTKTPNCKPPAAIPIHKTGSSRQGVIAGIGLYA